MIFYIYTINFVRTYIGKCGYPEVNHDVRLERYSMPALNGSTITFQCHPGYVIHGPLEATCNSSGDWSPDPRNTECVGKKVFPNYISSIIVTLTSDPIPSLTLNIMPAHDWPNIYTYDMHLWYHPTGMYCVHSSAFISNPLLRFCCLQMQLTVVHPLPMV